MDFEPTCFNPKYMYSTMYIYIYKIIKPCNNNCNCMQWSLRKSPEGYRIQEGDLVVKVNGVAADGPLAHHMPAIAGKVMEVRGNRG